MSDGMFLSACREVSKEFPDVTYDEDLLDRVCLQVCFIYLWQMPAISNSLLGCYQPQALLGSRDGHAKSIWWHPIRYVRRSYRRFGSHSVWKYWTCKYIYHNNSQSQSLKIWSRTLPSSRLFTAPPLILQVRPFPSHNHCLLLTGYGFV